MTDDSTKATGTIVELASKAGGFFARVLNTVPEDFVGLIGGDWLRHKRAQNWIDLELRTRKIIQEKGFDGKWKTISPKFFIEWSESASLESDDSIKRIWSNLMAATLDPKQRLDEEPFLIDALKMVDKATASAFSKIYSASYHDKDVLDPYIVTYTSIEITEGVTKTPNLIGYQLEHWPRISIGDIKGGFECLQKLAVLGLITGLDSNATTKERNILLHAGTGNPERVLFLVSTTWLGQKLHRVVNYAN